MGNKNGFFVVKCMLRMRRCEWCRWISIGKGRNGDGENEGLQVRKTRMQFVANMETEARSRDARF